VADPTTLFLIRHGEIDRPPVYTFDDAVLTNRGADQIHEVALAWAHPIPDMIYCSPLPRSVETASIFAAVFRRPIRTAHDLEEWAATESDVPDYKYKEIERQCWADFNYGNDDGESLHHATDRIVRLLTEIADRHKGRAVMVSGHAILFALLVAYVRGDRATESSKDRIGFGHYAIAEHARDFRFVRDFGP